VALSSHAAPVENMPAVVAFIGQADPIRWMLVVTRGLFLQDMPVSLMLQTASLLLIAMAACGVAWVAVRCVVI
jgi:ABC-2 type transport system permease protein